MKRKAEKPTGRRHVSPVFKGFINYTLTDEQRQLLKDMGVDHDRLWDTFEALSENGWVVKFSHDFYNHCEQATISCADGSNVNAGWYLSGRGSTPMKAFRQALYIAEQIDWELADYGERQAPPKQRIDD